MIPSQVLRIIVLIGTLNVFACAVPDLGQYADRAVEAGATVKQMRQRRGINPEVWDKPTYHLPNGNAVYVESIGYSIGYKGCEYHWEVNKDRRVVGYKIVGDRCW